MSKDETNEIEMQENKEQSLLKKPKELNLIEHESVDEKPVNFSPFLILSALSIHSVFFINKIYKFIQNFGKNRFSKL